MSALFVWYMDVRKMLLAFSIDAEVIGKVIQLSSLSSVYALRIQQKSSQGSQCHLPGRFLRSYQEASDSLYGREV